MLMNNKNGGQNGRGGKKNMMCDYMMSSSNPTTEKTCKRFVSYMEDDILRKKMDTDYMFKCYMFAHVDCFNNYPW